jgi:hypothetical protein
VAATGGPIWLNHHRVGKRTDHLGTSPDLAHDALEGDCSCGRAANAPVETRSRPGSQYDRLHQLSRLAEPHAAWTHDDLVAAPVQRWRRSASMRSITGCGVGWRSRWGRELRSCNPAHPPSLKRRTHFRTVRGQTPTASLVAFGVCPLRTMLTKCSRPSGVRRAFLWMSIRLPQGPLNSRQAQLPSPPGPNGQPIESSHLAGRAIDNSSPWWPEETTR